MRDDDLQDIFKNKQGSVTKKIVFFLLAGFFLVFLYINFFSGMPSQEMIATWTAKNKSAFEKILLNKKSLNYVANSLVVAPSGIEVDDIQDWETAKFFDLEPELPSDTCFYPASLDEPKPTKSKSKKDLSENQVDQKVKKLLPDLENFDDSSKPVESQMKKFVKTNDLTKMTSRAQRIAKLKNWKEKDKLYFARGKIKFKYQQFADPQNMTRVKNAEFTGYAWILFNIKTKTAIPIFIIPVKYNDAKK